MKQWNCLLKIFYNDDSHYVSLYRTFVNFLIQFAYGSYAAWKAQVMKTLDFANFFFLIQRSTVDMNKIYDYLIKKF
jgi:hypothetical protein